MSDIDDDDEDRLRMLDAIDADEICTLTETLDRAFRAAGCVPECHCCGRTIRTGRKFKLAYIERTQWPHVSTDEMLCYRCTPAKLLEKENAQLERMTRGGFTRIHR